MPIIATKIAAGGLAVATALGSVFGGYFVKDDISQTISIASDYIGVKIDRHYDEAVKEEINTATNKRFSSQGGNP